MTDGKPRPQQTLDEEKETDAMLTELAMSEINRRMADQFDVAIVGGGPAGLSAALTLGRSRRSVVVLDHNKPRNFAAHAVHGYLGLDGIAPAQLRTTAANECRAYGVTFMDAEVIGGYCHEARGATFFDLELRTGTKVRARKLLFATGVVDHLPQVPGFENFYGATAHHCPYCDGWEHKDKRLVAYGKASSAPKLAIDLQTWSKHVTCCTDGDPLPSGDRAKLQKYGITYRPEKISALIGDGNKLEKLRFVDGNTLDADALFFSAGKGQRSRLPEAFGCKCDADGLIVSRGKQGSGIRGLFIAGDADGDVQFAIVAAAEGAIAATAINSEITEEDFP